MRQQVDERFDYRTSADPGYHIRPPVDDRHYVTMDEYVVVGSFLVFAALLVKAGAKVRQLRARKRRAGVQRAAAPQPAKPVTPVVPPLPSPPPSRDASTGDGLRAHSAKAAASDVLLMLDHAPNATAAIRRDIVASVILQALRHEEERIRSYMRPSVN